MVPKNVFDNREDARKYLEKIGDKHHEIVVWNSKDGLRWSVVMKPRKRGRRTTV